MEQTILLYERRDGKCPFSIWIRDLRDVKARAVINARIGRIQLGNFGDCKSVGSGVLELRINYGPGYRVYFGIEANTLVVLLCGGDKKTQFRDIVKAKAFWEEYKSATKKL